MDLPDLKVNLELAANGFDVTVRKAGQLLRTLSGNFDDSAASARRAEEAMHRVGSSFKSTVVTLGALRFALMDLDDFLLAFPKSVAKAGGEFERMQMLMQGLSKSSDEMVRKMEGMRDMAAVMNFAKTAPFDVKALSDTFVKLKTAGLDPAVGSMSALVNSAAKFGATSDTLKRASIAIQQMAGKGVVSMEELRQQLGEAIPNAMEMMARGLGISVAELTNKVGKGVVTTRTAIARMFAQMELDSRGAAERMMGTFPGALSKLKTDFELFQKTIADQGFLSTLSFAMKDLSAYLESPAGQQFAQTLGRALREVTETLVEMARWVANNVDLLKNLGVALVSAIGGSKLAGAWSSISDRYAAIAAQQQKVVDIANVANAKEIASLEKKQQAQQRALRQSEQAARIETDARQSAMAQEETRFREYKQAQLAGLQEIRVAKREAAQEEISQLRSLEADRQRILNEQRRANLTGGFNLTGPTGAGGARNPGALLGGAATGSELRDVERSIALQRQRVAASIDEAKAVGTLIQAKNAEQLAVRGGVTELERQIMMQREGIAQTEKEIAQKRAMPGLVNQAGSAITGFARSLAGGLLWAGAFYLAIEGLTFIYEKLTKNAREAAAAVLAVERAKLGQALDDDPESIRKVVENKKANLANRQGERAAVARAAAMGDGTAAYSLKAMDADIDRIKREIDDMESSLSKSSAQVADNKVMRESQALLNKIQKDADSILAKSTLFDTNQSLNADMAKAVLEKNDTEVKRILKEQEALGPEYERAKSAAYNKATEGVLATIKDGDQRVLSAVKKGADDQKGALARNYANIIDKDVFGAGKGGKKGDTPFENFIQAQERAIQKLKNTAETWKDGVVTLADLKTSAIATIDEMERYGDFGKDDKGNKIVLGVKQRQQAIDAVFNRSRLELVDKARAKLIPLLQQIEAEDERVAEVFSGEKIYRNNKQQNGAQKLIAELEPLKDVLKDSLDAAGLSWEQFKDRLSKGANFSALASVVQSLREETKKLEEEAIVDDRERQRLITKNHIEEAGKRLSAEVSVLLATGTLSEAQVQKIHASYAALSAYIDAENAALAVKTRTAAQVMAEEWGKGMRSMEQATAKWANDFIDRLVDGQVKVRRLIEQMVGQALKDMAKIKIKEALSGSIGGVLDSATKQLGSFLGLNGAGKQQARYDGATGALLVKNVESLPGSVPTPGADGATAQKSFFDQITEGFGRVWDWMKNGFDKVTSFLGDNLSQLMNGMSSMLSDVLSSLASMMSSGGGDTQSLMQLGEMAASFFGFATGGVMTGRGPVSLRAYANGGIANRPQLALFGEGSKPEAFVPLPDGRRIPVALSGAGAGGAAPAAAAPQEPPQVTINLINQTGQATEAKQGSVKFDGRKAVLDIVLTGASQPGPFRDNLRSVMNQK